MVATLLLFLLVQEPPRGGQFKLKTTSDEMEEKKTGDGNVEEKEADFSEDVSKKEVSVTQSQTTEGLISENLSIWAGIKSLLKPPVLILCLAACIRHTGEFIAKDQDKAKSVMIKLFVDGLLRSEIIKADRSGFKFW